MSKSPPKGILKGPEAEAGEGRVRFESAVTKVTIIHQDQEQEQEGVLFSEQAVPINDDKSSESTERAVGELQRKLTLKQLSMSRTTVSTPSAAVAAAASPAPEKKIKMSKVDATRNNGTDGSVLAVDKKVGKSAVINCPANVLRAFQDLMRGTEALGATIDDPYNPGQVITIPSNAEELTPFHLQILARNENYNVTGVMQFGQYNGLLTDGQVCQLRNLVRMTNVASVMTVHSYKGYNPVSHEPRTPLAESDEKRYIIVDQTGLQFQQDFGNTGAMFFYPNNSNHEKLKDTKRYPNGYEAFADQMFQDSYGYKRPPLSSASKADFVEVSWGPRSLRGEKTKLEEHVEGKISKALYRQSIEYDFLAFLAATKDQADSLEADVKVCARFVKAGLGFFSENIGKDNPELQKERLEGILAALNKAKKGELGKIQRIELPYSSSSNAEVASLITKIQERCQALGLGFSAENKDVLTPLEGFVVASTNGGDNHAFFGNEGHYGSLDAAISCNVENPNILNPVVNTHMGYAITPDVMKGNPLLLKPVVQPTRASAAVAAVAVGVSAGAGAAATAPTPARVVATKAPARAVAPPKYEYVDVIIPGEGEFGVRFAEDSGGYLIPVVVEKRLSEATGAYEYQEFLSPDSAVPAEDLYDVPDREDGWRRNFAPRAVSEGLESGETYLARMTGTSVVKFSQQHLDGKTPSEIALEWVKLHKSIMELQDGIAAIDKEISRLNQWKGDIEMPTLAGPAGTRASEATHMTSGGEGDYVEFLNPRSNADALRVQLKYAAKVNPLAEQIRRLEAEKAKKEADGGVLESHAQACQDNLRKSNPEAFVGAMRNLGEQIGDRAPAPLPRADRAGVGVGAGAGAGAGASDGSRDIYAVPTRFNSGVAPETSSGRPPQPLPRRAAAGSVATYTLSGLPGSSESVWYNLELSYAGSASGADVGNTFLMRVVSGSSQEVELVYYKNIFQKWAKTHKTPFKGRKLRDGLPVLFSPSAVGAAGSASTDIYEAPTAKYDYNFNNAKKLIEEAVEKPVLVAYLIDLNGHIEAAQARSEIYGAAAAADADKGVKLGALHQVLGLLTDKLKNFTEVGASLTRGAKPSRGTGGVDSGYIEVVPDPESEEEEELDTEEGPEEPEEPEEEEELGDAASVTEERYEFRPVISAEKVLPEAVADEKFLSVKETNKARDFATKMAYMAVNAEDDEKAKQALEAFISQNYKELVDAKILGAKITELFPRPATSTEAGYDETNPNHRKQVAQAMSAEIAEFVKKCREYDGSNPAFNDFRKKIGLTENPANPQENKISWVENDVVSDKDGKTETFVWQRIFLAAQRAQIAKEADLTPIIERAGKEAQKAHAKQAKEKLFERYKGDPDDEASEAGLARTSKVFVDASGNESRYLTAEGIAMHMALYEAQETQVARGFDVFSYLSYEDFAELSANVAMLDVTSATSVEEQSKLVVENGIDNLFGGYSEFGGSQEGRLGARSRSLTPILWMLREHAAQVDPNNGDNKTFGQLFAKIERLEREAVEELKNNTDPSQVAAIQARIEAAKKAKEQVAQDLINDLLSKDNNELNELYQKARKGAQDKALAGSDDELASASMQNLGDSFDQAKARLKERRQKSPPRVTDVMEARSRMVDLFADNTVGGKKLPAGWVFQGGSVTTESGKYNHLADFTFADTPKFELDELSDAFRKRKVLTESDLNILESVRSDKTKANLQQYLEKPDEYSVGDDSLFSAKGAVFSLEGGIMVAEFDQPSCLADLAEALERPSSKSAKEKIKAGQTVHNLAVVSGKDGVKRNNRYVLISQNKRGSSATFTTEAIAEQEIFGKNQEFYKMNFEYEARIALMQQAADISLVYLNDYIAAEFRKNKTPLSDPPEPLYASMEDVLKLEHVVALSEYNRDLNALLKDFGPKEQDSAKERAERMANFSKFIGDAAPNLNPPYFVSEATSFDGILQGLEGQMKEAEEYNPTAPTPATVTPPSVSREKFGKLKGQIKNPTELTAAARAAVESKARKYGQAQMQHHLQERELAEAVKSKLLLKLDEKDVKVIAGDYTSGGKSDLKKLLTADIPTPLVSGISIYKPKPGDEGYFRYNDSSKNRAGKANTAIVVFKLPTDEDLLEEMDDIAWIYLPGTPQCYVKAQVDFKTGKITISEEIYHKSKGAGYEAINPNKESVTDYAARRLTSPTSQLTKKDELTDALGEIDAEKVRKIYQNFSVLAVCEQGGIRKGVSAFFDGKAVNKGRDELKARTTSATLNQNSRAKNLDCKFEVDANGKVRENPNPALMAGLCSEADIASSQFAVTIDDIESKFSARGLFEVKGVKIDGKNVLGLKFVHAVGLGADKFTRLDSPKAVLTYKDEDGKTKSLVLREPDLMSDLTVALGRAPDFTKINPQLDALKAQGIRDRSEVATAQPATLMDGTHLPQSFGAMKDGYNPDMLRIVLPVMAFDEKGKSKMSFGDPVIEYFKDNKTNPRYMALTPENLSEFYKNAISEDDYNSFAAKMEAQRLNLRVPVVFFREAGKEVEQTELKLKVDEKSHEVNVDFKKGSVPSTSCSAISASLAFGNIRARGNSGAAIAA